MSEWTITDEAHTMSRENARQAADHFRRYERARGLRAWLVSEATKYRVPVRLFLGACGV